MRRTIDPPVAFFVSLTPRKIRPRSDVAMDCEVLVYLVAAGRNLIGSSKTLLDVTFGGVEIRHRFDGCGLEGSQWIVDADENGAVLEHDVSTNGTRIIRDDDATLARCLAPHARTSDLFRDGLGTLLPSRDACSFALREGDVLATFYDAWIFAPLRKIS